MKRVMKRVMWRVALAAVVAACLLPAGCKSKKDESSASGSAAAAAAPAAAAGEDACALLTAEEIKSVVGKEVTKSGHGAADSSNVCEYDLGEAGQVLTTVYTTAGKETFDGAPGDAVPGLGDQAKLIAEGMLAVLKGGTSFTVGALMFDATTAEQKLAYAKALAAKMLERL
jgi:hypothetical protein